MRLKGFGFGFRLLLAMVIGADVTGLLLRFVREDSDEGAATGLRTMDLATIESGA